MKLIVTKQLFAIVFAAFGEHMESDETALLQLNKAATTMKGIAASKRTDETILDITSLPYLDEETGVEVEAQAVIVSTTCETGLPVNSVVRALAFTKSAIPETGRMKINDCIPADKHELLMLDPAEGELLIQTENSLLPLLAPMGLMAGKAAFGMGAGIAGTAASGVSGNIATKISNTISAKLGVNRTNPIITAGREIASSIDRLAASVDNLAIASVPDQQAQAAWLQRADETVIEFISLPFYFEGRGVEVEAQAVIVSTNCETGPPISSIVKVAAVKGAITELGTMKINHCLPADEDAALVLNPEDEELLIHTDDDFFVAIPAGVAILGAVQ